jgi:hypothetical protein
MPVFTSRDGSAKMTYISAMQGVTMTLIQQNPGYRYFEPNQNQIVN